MNKAALNLKIENKVPVINNSISPNSLAFKIYTVTINVFITVIKLITFPSRYFGAKTWSIPGLILKLPLNLILRKPIFGESNYHFTTQKSLTPEEVRPFLKYAAINAASFSCDSKWIDQLDGLELHEFQENDINLSDLPPKIEIRKNCLIDLESGLKIVICKNDKEVIIAFGSLGALSSELQNENQKKATIVNQKNSAVSNFLGFSPNIYCKASLLLEVLKKSKIVSGKKISLTGQSFGGSLASYVGIKQEMPTYCFNSFPLGAGLQAELGSKVLERADQYVTHISAENDRFSDNRLISLLDRIISLFPIKTPGNFGKRLSIPSSYKDADSTHKYVLGNIMRHLGYDVRCYPKDAIKAEDLIDTTLITFDKYSLQSPELLKKIIIHTIKTSFCPNQGLNLNYFFNLELVSDVDLVALINFLKLYKKNYENVFGSKNRHIDYAKRTIELAILMRVNQNPEKQKYFINKFNDLLNVNLLTVQELNNFKHALDRASGQNSIVYSLIAKSKSIGLTSLKNAQISLSPADNRPAAPKTKKSVLHAALEYNRGTVGGLGVVTRSLLPQQKDYGHEACMITPFFSFYHDTLKDKEIKFITFIEHEFKGKMIKSAIYKVCNGDVKAGKEVKHYLVMPTPILSSLFDVGEVKDLYANYEHSGSSDRLLYFSSAVAAFAGTYHGLKQKKSFDVLHLHGWHTGAASLLLDTHYNPMRDGVGLPPVKRIFQVHLSAEQGIHNSIAYKNIGLNTQSKIINIHADALNTSDAIVYVSNAAANDAITEKHGWGLHKIALKRDQEGKVKGITNGITHKNYDPSNPDVFGRFALDDLNHASQVKASVKQYAYEQNLIAHPTKPLFMFVGRYSSEKGIDMLPSMVKEIAKKGGQTLIMGVETQDTRVAKSLDTLKSLSQDKNLNLRFFSKIEDQTALVGDSGVQAGNIIRLATDISLVPSHEEACGLVPMELLSVGALVLTSQVQGLKDTCKGLGDINSDNNIYSLDNFNSFTYDNNLTNSRNSIRAISQAFDYLKNTPSCVKDKVTQRLISSSKQYDWLQQGGAIQQMEEVYLQA